MRSSEWRVLQFEQVCGRSWKNAANEAVEKWPEDHLKGRDAKKDAFLSQEKERGTEMEVCECRGRR